MTEPAILIPAAHVSRGSNRPVTRIVVHTTSPGSPDPADPTHLPWPKASAAGTARGTARYFASPKSGGSAHYIEDVAEEYHSVPEASIAWHAPPNPHSIGVEICAQPWYTREQWLSPEVWPAVERARSRVVDLCQRHGVPFVRVGVKELLEGRPGVCGHWDVSQAFKESDHTDPGINFPWDVFMTGNQAQPGPIIHFEEDDDMGMFVLDAKGPDDVGRESIWQVDKQGNLYAWNGARDLKTLKEVGVNLPLSADVAGLVGDPSGDAVVVVLDDGHQEPNGHWVRTTYKVPVR